MTIENHWTRDHLHCITCSDSAISATVVRVDGDTATVEHQGEREQVGVELVAPVLVGDVLLCHAGIALDKLPDLK
jgi:hydrogenase maturation factor